MLGMIGHVPGNEAHRRGGQQRAGVGQHVALALVAAGMFGKQIGAKEWRTDNQWHQQIRNQPPGISQCRHHHQIEQHHQARLVSDNALHGLRHIGIAAPPGCVAENDPYIAGPERNAAEIGEVATDTRRFWRVEFGVPVRILSEFVMILMEIEKPFRPDQERHSSQHADGTVQPLAAKGSAVAAFMHRREQEHHANPLAKHGCPAHRTLTDDIAPQAQRNQRQMAGELNQPTPVGTFRQRALLVCRKAAQHIPMRDDVRRHNEAPIGW